MARIALVGEKGAKAAWRIALHSIAEPAFMRQCRDLLDAASQSGDAPRWQFAIIDDRIRVYEGLPQRYGTHAPRAEWPRTISPRK